MNYSGFINTVWMMCLVTMMSVLLISPVTGQKKQIHFEEVNQTLGSVFEVIEEQTLIGFVYSEDDISPSATIDLEKKDYELDELLNTISAQMKLTFQRMEDHYIVTVKKAIKGQTIIKMIRGQVKDGHESLPGASVYLQGQLEYSTSTDVNGNFEMEVPLGRGNLLVSFVGYETVITPLLITSGEEKYLPIQMEQQISNLNEVIVEADRDKAATQNDRVYASGRGFSVAEANRYAGTLGDPARMVRSFAGVMPVADGRNDIIIRGNSPTGIQWKLDNIEIPNPNHYGGIGLTGNTTTLLNMNLIDNSDFLMGAFPAEYGNALSGVFDLNTKKINPKKRQFRFQTGWNGIELGADGPFSKKSEFGTYSLTYRYSFLDLVKHLGIDMGVLPQFQDLSGKFDFKLSPKTELSLLGIWGTSYIELDDHDLDDADDLLTGQYLRTGSDLSLAGVNITHQISDDWLLKSNVSVIDNRIKTKIDTFNVATDLSNEVFTDQSGETKYSLFSQLEHRKERNSFLTGVRWDTYVIDYNSYSINDEGDLQSRYNQISDLNLLRIYASDEFRFTNRLRARAGIHSQYFLFNGSFALEPRMAVQYYLSDRNKLALSLGNHHMLQPRTVYFVESHINNERIQTNNDLGFSGANHLILSYDHTFSDHLRFKAETYYQQLYDIPVEQNINSSFSMVNVGADFFIPDRDSLVNEGLGRNYGIELTLERFLDKGYYFLLNTSLYKSEYQTLKKEWRSTAFDMHYTMNAVAGYEKWFGQKFAIGADLKVTYAGGKPYLPVDETASIAAEEVIYDHQNAFDVRYRQYFRTDLKIYYRINYKRVYTEFAMDFQNLTDHQNIFKQEFDTRTGTYRTEYQMAFFPMFTFRCLF